LRGRSSGSSIQWRRVSRDALGVFPFSAASAGTVVKIFVEKILQPAALLFKTGG